MWTVSISDHVNRLLFQFTKTVRLTFSLLFQFTNVHMSGTYYMYVVRSKVQTFSSICCCCMRCPVRTFGRSVQFGMLLLYRLRFRRSVPSVQYAWNLLPVILHVVCSLFETCYLYVVCSLSGKVLQFLKTEITENQTDETENRNPRFL